MEPLTPNEKLMYAAVFAQHAHSNYELNLTSASDMVYELRHAAQEAGYIIQMLRHGGRIIAANIEDKDNQKFFEEMLER